MSLSGQLFDLCDVHKTFSNGFCSWTNFSNGTAVECNEADECIERNIPIFDSELGDDFELYENYRGRFQRLLIENLFQSYYMIHITWNRVKLLKRTIRITLWLWLASMYLKLRSVFRNTMANCHSIDWTFNESPSKRYEYFSILYRDTKCFASDEQDAKLLNVLNDLGLRVVFTVSIHQFITVQKIGASTATI